MKLSRHLAGLNLFNSKNTGINFKLRATQKSKCPQKQSNIHHLVVNDSSPTTTFLINRNSKEKRRKNKKCARNGNVQKRTQFGLQTDCKMQ